ncbi:mycofactocin system transcriptional regulator [Rhodococcus triatomae]|uniref:Mycofactocin system transcriptional regulator n=1 Tax=Rhodococcus triatomae TaxID=300028 RepID=A0A1G8JJ58_9NOCA|nr:mycofactocin system transcriptional regulator [Rhodococcus triatomae]QNG19704.1 mycofactocin system transcriptional regulator [Rhodococcus triatomae]QNG24381.1 mycofactocin system transcriptional regulator [Rhodococcus triatomae]SDI31245.1 mycofactocin system transcriptional regulator [Rhodococcus triatomae]
MGSRTSQLGTSRLGRRPATTQDRISTVGIDLFSKQGFDETSVDEVAEACGIARRTLFRYFPSKNAIPWGDFDAHLATMRERLHTLPPDLTVVDALTAALLEFNTFPVHEASNHRKRMKLILEVPALQAYSVVMYQGWRDVVADYVAERLGTAPTDHVPRTVGHVLLGVAMAAYETWLTNDETALPDLLREGMDCVAGGLTALTR